MQWKLWEREADEQDLKVSKLNGDALEKDLIENLKEKPNRNFEREENPIGFPMTQNSNRDYKIISVIEIPFCQKKNEERIQKR